MVASVDLEVDRWMVAVSQTWAREWAWRAGRAAASADLEVDVRRKGGRGQRCCECKLTHKACVFEVEWRTARAVAMVGEH